MRDRAAATFDLQTCDLRLLPPNSDLRRLTSTYRTFDLQTCDFRHLPPTVPIRVHSWAVLQPPPSGSDPTVETFDPLADEHWDEGLSTYSAASFFHSKPWMRVLQSTYGFKPVGFRTPDGSSCLPCMEVQSWLTGRRGVSLPFSDTCEPLVTDLESFEKLLEVGSRHAAQRKWKYWEWRGGRAPVPSPLPPPTFLEHTLELDGDERFLFGRFTPACRRAIRKAERARISGNILLHPQGNAGFL